MSKTLHLPLSQWLANRKGQSMNIPHKLGFTFLNGVERRAVRAWADSHDWGGEPAMWTGDDHCGARTVALQVSCAAFDRDGRESVETYLAHTFADLRGWAGY